MKMEMLRDIMKIKMRMNIKKRIIMKNITNLMNKKETKTKDKQTTNEHRN